MSVRPVDASATPNGLASSGSSCVIVGCGAIVELQYVPAICALENLTVVGLMDPSASRVEAVRGKFPGAVRMKDLRGLVADFAIVASPAAHHAVQAIAAMEAGMHVLCEKPMATTVGEAEAMVAAAERTGKLLAVGLFRRFFPATQAIREFIANATFGSVKRYQIAEGGEFDWPAVSATFFQKTHAGGGVLLDLGAHTLDLVRHWFGDAEDVVYEDDADGGLEASCLVQMTHSGGVKGEVRLSRDWRTANRYFVEFERGWVAWRPAFANRLECGANGCRYVAQAELAEVGRAWGLPAAGRPELSYQQCFTAQLAQFVDAIGTGGQPRVSGADGLANLKLIQRCYDAKGEGAGP
ncbi:MAG: Gfo/Idh/MocA family protein [Fimbriimonadaceae bacterium]